MEKTAERTMELLKLS